MSNLLGGHIDVISASSPNVIGQAQAGMVRVLAVATDQRLGGVLAAVPTWKEAGVNASFSSVQGVFGPKGMSAEQIRFWESNLHKVSESAEWKQFLAAQNWRPLFMGSAEMQKYIESEYIATKSLLDELNLTGKEASSK
jgi:putative tricarboxylic transport membrane protein